MNQEFGLVKSLVVDFLAQKSSDGAEPPIREVSDDFDMLAEGALDSFGFIELVNELELRLGVPIDLADLGPDELTVVGPLCHHIAEKRAATL